MAASEHTGGHNRIETAQRRGPVRRGARSFTAAPIAAQPGAAAVVDDTPLALDLDRTLLRSDLLVEGALALVRRKPLAAFSLVGWLLRGRAHLKRKVAEAGALDLSTLPVNDELAAFAARQKAEGRRVVVATAADESAARALCVRFPFVDEVVGSDGATNLKGEAKARMLAFRFPRGFDYAGDSAADLPIWRACRKMILVEPSRAVERAARAIGQPRLVIERPSRWRAALKAMRLHQWAKNALVFAPLALAGKIGDIGAWKACALAFFGLGLTASATYLINDLIDLPADRAHRTKSSRPLASGRLPIGAGVMLAAGGLVAGLALGALAGPGVLACLLAYIATTFAYSLKLKRAPFVDVTILAALFTLRLAIGVVAAHAILSPWLMTFSMFLFLSLSLAKRHVEITHARTGDPRRIIPGRGYRGEDEPIVAAFGVAAAVASALIFVLYLVNEAFRASALMTPQALWLFPAILFLWLARIWLLCARREMDDDPVAFSVRDRVSLYAGLASAATFVAAMIDWGRWL